jgi:hypothetical protein
VVTDTGGPDAYGYRWQDSHGACGPVFQWLPISSLGTPLTFGAGSGDSVRGPFFLGFNFPFYGQIYDRIWISANGWISFTDSVFSDTLNDRLPTASAPAASICGWWDDLKPQLSGTNLRFWSNGLDSAAAHYENVRAGSGGNQGTYNFQILLTARGDIQIFYGSMGTIRLNSATIGIQDHTRTRGLTILSDEVGVGSNEARRFALGPRSVSVNPVTGVVSPGQFDTLTVLFDGAALCGNPSTTALILRSNDVTNSVAAVPLRSTITTLVPPVGLTMAPLPNCLWLRWPSVSQAASYRVERAAQWNGPFTTLAVTADTVLLDTSAYSQDGPLYYQVRSVSPTFHTETDRHAP